MNSNRYYSSMKILHHKNKLDSLEIDKSITAPVHIRIKPTNICNHKCYYCSYQNSYGQLGQHMNKFDVIPYDRLTEIIGDCEEIGVKAITFSGGGEPLMYPKLTEIIKNTTLKTAILTNGVLLKDEIAEIIADKCSWVRISVDGYDRESYSNYRGCDKADYDKLIDNVKNFRLKGCRLGVNIIIDHINVRHLTDMIRLWNDLGANIKLSPAIISNDSNVNNLYHSKLMPLVKEQVNRANISLYNSYHIQLEGFDKDYQWCPYIQILPIIGADLKVYVCHDKAYNKQGVLGDLANQTFKSFWFNDKMKFFKINPAVDCRHHCVTDKTNKMILEYLKVKHKDFV